MAWIWATFYFSKRISTSPLFQDKCIPKISIEHGLKLGKFLCSVKDIGGKKDYDNLCDETSFPFFSILPEEVTIHHYVSLHKLIHQTKLETLWKHGNSSATGIAHKDVDTVMDTSHCDADPSLLKPSWGHCWPWTEMSPDESGENENAVKSCIQHMEVVADRKFCYSLAYTKCSLISCCVMTPL